MSAVFGNDYPVATQVRQSGMLQRVHLLYDELRREGDHVVGGVLATAFTPNALSRNRQTRVLLLTVHHVFRYEVLFKPKLRFISRVLYHVFRYGSVQMTSRI